MKAKNLLAVVIISILSLTAAAAQIGSNYGNPCLHVKQGPNTLKTKKHDTHKTNSRFNSHIKTKGNGNAHPYTSAVKPKYAKKHKLQGQVATNKKHGRKNNHRKDRGDK
jgi:hypothetical protein